MNLEKHVMTPRIVPGGRTMKPNVYGPLFGPRLQSIRFRLPGTARWVHAGALASVGRPVHHELREGRNATNGRPPFLGVLGIRLVEPHDFVGLSTGELASIGLTVGYCMRRCGYVKETL